jgi:hypothetical protein
VNSAALLLRSAGPHHPRGLGNSSGLVGAHYMAHLATMLQGVSWRRNDDDFQKTVAINDFYLRGPDTPFPLGQIQSQGRTDARMAKAVGDTWRHKGIDMRHIPLWAYEAWVSRANDWLVMSEDLPRPENRVTLTPDGRIQLAYRPTNMTAHRRLVAVCVRRLADWAIGRRRCSRTPPVCTTRRISAEHCGSAPTRAHRCWTPCAAPTTSRTSTSSMPRSSPRRPP